MYKDFVSSEFTPSEVPDELYKTYLALSGIPQEDWNKQSTSDTIQEV